MNNKDIVKYVSDKAIEGITEMQDIILDKIDETVNMILKTEGKIVIGGIGKSGHIARKISATLASTGTPSFFIHPAEASHGDMGMITEKDLVILLSNSGETTELKDIIDYVTRFNIKLISVTRKKSTLSKLADIAFILPETEEASPVGAPTTSTTMSLVWGDIIAMSLLAAKGFKKEDFKILHPGGKLGSILARAEELMRKGKDIPITNEETLMSKVIIEMSSKNLGCVAITGKNGTITGIITDGDLRRHSNENFLSKKAKEIMTKSPHTISKDTPATEAMKIMNNKAITSLFITDKHKKCLGVLHIHDLLRAGII